MYIAEMTIKSLTLNFNMSWKMLYDFVQEYDSVMLLISQYFYVIINAGQ